MNVGATEQEIQESKKIDLSEPDRKQMTRRPNRSPVYYYQLGDEKPDRKYFPEDIYVPIENYSSALIRDLDLYLNKIRRTYDVDTLTVLATLRSVIFPNDKESQILSPTNSISVWAMVQQYTRCIMQLVGELAECVLVDSCANNAEINKTCINIALFKSDILETYDIPYDDYVAYSTSFSYLVYKDPKDGIYKPRKNVYYNPNHTSMDIGWCKKNNIWDQLRTELDEINYVETAKLQVKATLHCETLDLNNYILTPVIVFDFDHGFDKLRKRYPHNSIYSAYNLFPEIALQMEKNFQIIAAYVSGMTTKLNITETDLKNDKRLQTLFNTSVREITNRDNPLDRTGLIKLAKDAGKPVIVMG